MIVLDTNIISALMRAAPDEAVQAWLDRQAADSIWTTAINAFELHAGIEMLADRRRRQRLEQTLKAILAEEFEERLLPFDGAAAEAAAALWARRRRVGRPVELRDTQIAGIVVVHRARLATFNGRHFSDLDVEVIHPHRS